MGHQSGHDREPWEVRWRWSTGYSGVDRFRDGDKALTFCDEMFRRTDPPQLELSVSVRNTVTGERLRDYIRQKRIARPPLVWPAVRWEAVGVTACGTCDGTGEIPIIQTGQRKTCTRCDGTGQE